MPYYGDNTYAPYGSLSELLAAAGVAPADVDRHSTPQLLARAAARSGSGPRPVMAPVSEPTPVPGAKERTVWATRSIRLPLSVEREVDLRARRANSNFNAVVCALITEWITK